MPTLIKANPMPGLALGMLLNSKSHGVPRQFGLERRKNNGGLLRKTRRSRRMLLCRAKETVQASDCLALEVQAWSEPASGAG